MSSAYNLLARKRWWTENSPELERKLFDEVRGATQDLKPQTDLMLTYLRAYSLQQANLLRGYGSISINDQFAKLRMNIIKSVIDTATAHIGVNKVRPFFMTRKGTQVDRDNAMTLNRAVLGLFYIGNHYDVAPKVFEGGAIFGLGSELVQATTSGRIKYDRVIPFEQKWDPAEATSGPPRNRYITKEVSRYELENWAEAYGKKIKNPGGCELIEHIWTTHTDKDSCTLVFAWHLASEDGEEDGRFVVATSNQVLHDSVYDRATPPLVDFHIQRPQVGWIGDGYASELLPFQMEVNYVIQKQQNLINLATTQIWVRKGEGLGKIDNRDMAVREYKNQPPTILPITPYSREFNEWREMIIAKAFQFVGLSPLAAQALKPAGLDSGQAIRTYSDKTSRRLQEVDQNWDQHHVKVAEATLEECRRLVKTGRAPKHILAMGDRHVEKLPFDKLTQLDRNNYSIMAYPTSMLPEEPAGKIQLAQDLANISPEFAPNTFAMMTGIPDIEATADRINAPYDLLRLHLGSIMEGRGQKMPNGNMDLAYARIETERAICQAEKDDLPYDVIDGLVRYQAEVDRLQNPPAPPMAPPGVSMPGMPGQAPIGMGLPPGMGMPPGMGPPGGGSGMMTPGAGPTAIPSPQAMSTNPTGTPPLLG